MTTVFAFYTARPGDELDLQVARAFGRYYSGAGGMLGSHERDASGSVPTDKVSEVVNRLEALDGVAVEVFEDE